MIARSVNPDARLGVFELLALLVVVLVLAPGAAAFAVWLLGDGALLLVGLAIGGGLPALAAWKLGGARG